MNQNISLKLTPTLLVGLGGTGKMVLSQVKKQFVDHPLFGSVPPLISFLSIDSDADPDKYQTEEEAMRSLDRNERLIITARVEGIKNFLSRKPYIRNWFPFEETRHVELSGRGAKQKRYLGRLIFFENVQEIQNRITESLANICNRRHALGSGVSMAESENIDVIVINSLCGGTGSGMFLDLSYLLRETAALHTAKNLKMTGYFLTSEAFNIPEFKENLRRNCAAALMELDLFMRPGHPDFSVSYSDSIKIERHIESRAFDICYLINGAEMPDHLTVEKTISQGIFTKIITSAGEKEASIQDNVEYDKVEKHENKYASFSTYGFGSFYFPNDQIANIFSHRLSRHLLEMILEKYDTGDRLLSEKLNIFFQKFQHSLGKGALDMLCNHEQHSRIIPPKPLPGFDSLSRDDIMNRANWWLNIDASPESVKRLDEYMGSNFDNFRKDFENQLEKTLEDQLNHFDQGIEFAWKFMNSIIDRLESFRTVAENNLAEKNQVYSRNKANIKEVTQELKGATESFWSLVSSSRINEISARLVNLDKERFKLAFDIARLNYYADAIRGLVDRLKAESKDNLGHLRDRMWIFKDRELPEKENALYTAFANNSNTNIFVNMFVCQPEEIALTGWYYNHCMGLTGIGDKDSKAWDDRESRCLKNINFGGNWRAFATRPLGLLDEILAFATQELSAISKKTIDDYLREKNQYMSQGDAQKSKLLYINILKDLMHSSRTTTQINKSRGSFDAKPVTILGMPSEDNSVFDKEIREKAQPIGSNVDIKCADIGYPQQVVMIQTLEGIPITGINTVSIWADAYENRDRYLHTIGKELGIDWEKNRLVMSDAMAHLAQVTWLYFSALECGLIKSRKKIGPGDARFEIIPKKQEKDSFVLEEPKGTPLGNTVEEAIQNLCERMEKREELQNRINNSSAYNQWENAQKAEIAAKYVKRLKAAIPSLSNENAKKAYIHITKALEWHAQKFHIGAQRDEDSKKMDF